jgi:hypothetical protein
MSWFDYLNFYLYFYMIFFQWFFWKIILMGHHWIWEVSSWISTLLFLEEVNINMSVSKEWCEGMCLHKVSIIVLVVKFILIFFVKKKIYINFQLRRIILPHTPFTKPFWLPITQIKLCKLFPNIKIASSNNNKSYI